MSGDETVSGPGGGRPTAELREAVRGALPDAELLATTEVERGKNAAHFVTVADGDDRRDLVLKVGDRHGAAGCRAEPHLLERVASASDSARGYREMNDLERGEGFESRQRAYRLAARLRLRVNLREEMAGRSESAVDTRAREHRSALEEYGVEASRRHRPPCSAVASRSANRAATTNASASATT